MKNKFGEYCEKYGDEWGEELLCSVCDALWHNHGNPGQSSHGVYFDNIHKYDVINCVMSGTIDFRGAEYRFIIQDGDWNGTEVLEFELEEEGEVGFYETSPPKLYYFVPDYSLIKEENWESARVIYENWIKEEWFKEKERGMNYDRFFMPGGKIKSHYGDWAAEKSLKVIIGEANKRPEHKIDY
jgi:hypothetical protein